MARTIFLGLALLSTAGIASEPAPRHLYDSGGTACVFLAENGVVTDVFMGTSTGSKRKDRDFVKWATTLRWAEQKREGEDRNVWVPVSLMSKIPATRPPKPDCDALAASR